jgi:uncharacterized protein (DUF362 family)
MISRREFVKLITAGGLAASVLPLQRAMPRHLFEDKTATNIADTLKYPRTKLSMPGLYPARVAQTTDVSMSLDGVFFQDPITEALKRTILGLTGTDTVGDAYRQFVSPGDIIGLKVNPVAGKELSTSLEITRAVIAHLVEAGIPKKNIVIWDRREFELYEVGFTQENFPGIRITGTERKDETGKFYNAEGKLYSEEMIDKDWYYWADCEQKYDEETLPYMVNEGKYSYFTKIVTKEVDKIINIPILKNAGASVTLCLKNLAYGAITNTGRLHKPLWSETSAEVCAFPPLRDKVVLNIIDGIKGCYNGGPGADPKFIYPFNTLLAGTDPVAVDRVGYELIYQKRLAEGIVKQEVPKGRKFLELAAELKLGEANLEKITIVRCD